MNFDEGAVVTEKMSRGGSGMKEKVGFIGLGAMGNPMVENLLKASYPLTVYDIDEMKMNGPVQRGAMAAVSCKEVAEKSEVVITMLPSSPHVEQAILGEDGVLEGLSNGTTVIDMSTIDPITTREIADILSSRGIGMLDAPVARGVPAAVAGTLAIFVGGDSETFRQFLPLLSVMGKDVQHVGGIGAGEVVKLVNNLILAVNVCTLSEGLVLGVKAGVAPGVLFNALSKGSANSFALQNHFKNCVFKGKFEKGVFPVEYILKDLNLALKTGENYHIPQYFGALAVQTYEAALAAGLGNRYYPVVVKVLENLTGVEVRADLSD